LFKRINVILSISIQYNIYTVWTLITSHRPHYTKISGTCCFLAPGSGLARTRGEGEGASKSEGEGASKSKEEGASERVKAHRRG
jgi:hypothetical protein